MSVSVGSLLPATSSMFAFYCLLVTGFYQSHTDTGAVRFLNLTYVEKTGTAALASVCWALIMVV